VDTGAQFPYESNNKEEFHRQFFGPGSMVYVCENSSTKEVVGGFYLRANFSGRSNHIANAAYMMKDSHRGQGIGTLLIKASLQIAKDRGFLAMQFNMVLSQNISAIRLYQKLGFTIVGTIPRAVRNPDGSYQDGYVLYRELGK
jgi:RimJ/RimL family protein N-acetyltransferase